MTQQQPVSREVLTQQPQLSDTKLRQQRQSKGEGGLAAESSLLEAISSQEGKLPARESDEEPAWESAAQPLDQQQAGKTSQVRAGLLVHDRL